MAATTRERRFSAMNLGSPWRGLCTLPLADPLEQRPAAMYLYAGLALGLVPIPPTDHVARFQAPLRPLLVAARDRTPAFTAPDRTPEFLVDPERSWP